METGVGRVRIRCGTLARQALSCLRVGLVSIAWGVRKRLVLLVLMTQDLSAGV